MVTSSPLTAVSTEPIYSFWSSWWRDGKTDLLLSRRGKRVRRGVARFTSGATDLASACCSWTRGTQYSRDECSFIDIRL